MAESASVPDVTAGFDDARAEERLDRDRSIEKQLEQVERLERALRAAQAGPSTN